MQSFLLNFSLLWLQYNNKGKSKEDVAELRQAARREFIV